MTGVRDDGRPAELDTLRRALQAEALKPGGPALARLATDARKLTRLASILEGMIEEFFDFSRAREVAPNGVTFVFQADGIDNAHFLVNELLDRCSDLDRRIQVIEDAAAAADDDDHGDERHG